MYKSALIGMDISYTRSPEIHAAIASVLGIQLDFKVFDVPYEGLYAAARELFETRDSFFVTKPYKTDIKRALDSLDTDCGVNFVRCSDKRGFNTDGVGFLRALDGCFKDWKNDVGAALVLGAGGAAYSVTEALIKSGKRVYVLNRTMKNAAILCKTVGAEIYLNQPAELIVNATSLGLHGEDALAALCVLPSFKYAFDLVYSPPETPFMRRNKVAGAQAANGEDMLIYQAIEGDKLMTGGDFDVAEVYAEAVKLLKK